MSIRLDVADYCHSCQDFSPDVTKPQRLRSGDSLEGYLSDTIVRCEYRKRCSAIKRYLELQMSKGENV